MVKEIHIKNFKSIYDLKIQTTGLNLFIGENGSGKSNLLEALVFVSAAKSNKLDNEFLSSRGIRITSPNLMRSAFDENEEKIEIGLTYDDTGSKKYTFSNENKDYPEWVKGGIRYTNMDDVFKKGHTSLTPEEIDSIVEEYMTKRDNKFKNFIIYSPENTSLRIFEKEGQILPLGINGEGLLKLLKVIDKYENQDNMNDIISSLQLFNWFEDIEIPDNEQGINNNILIQDKYLYRKFTQHSANEGFLFILFYITLVVAKETPSSFAIDNIDASLNPKLCTKLMTTLSDLCKKYKKQIFLTTHNPAILDGVDLADDNQKLFVVSRNKKGHTRMKNITLEDKPKSSTNEPIKLSEAFLRGYLGGLPKGF